MRQAPGHASGVGFRGALRVGAVVAAFHAVWIAAFLAGGHDVRDFIRIGPEFIGRSDASEVIRLDPGYKPPKNRAEGFEGQGYDGQFSYYIALDPGNARYYMDDAAYRYSRILHPIAARVLALGDADAVPWTLLLLNFAAVAAGTTALAAWLAGQGVTPWLALVFGLYPGLVIGLQRDLTEPLAYGLVAAAVLSFDFGGRRGVLIAGGLFGLAALARQTTVVFPVLFGLSIIAGRPNASHREGDRPRRLPLAAAFAALSLVPLAAWSGFLLAWLDSLGLGSGSLTPVPFGGLAAGPLHLKNQPPVVLFVALPAFVWAALAVGRLKDARFGRLELASLLSNVAMAVVFTSAKVWEFYTAASRVAAGVVLSALLCTPYLRRAPDRERLALAAATAGWLLLLPVVLVYGFADIV